MKLNLPNAYIKAVTNLMLKMGTGDAATLVPATAISMEDEVAPGILEELREGLRGKFFDMEQRPPVPSIPELAALTWRTEYEGGVLVFDLEGCEDLDFEVKGDTLEMKGVDVKSITFEPTATGRVAWHCTAIVRSDQKERGYLTALVKHNVKATFTKLTQKPLEPPEPQPDNPQRQLEVD